MKFFNKKNEIKDKKVNDKKLLEKEINNKKVNKLIKFDYFRVLRAIVWILIGVLILRGGISIFKTNDLESVMAENKKFLDKIENENSLEIRLFSFAEEFTRDYYTRYPKNKDDFKNRILKYTTEQLAIDMNNSSYSEIINTSAFYFEKYSDNQYNVSVMAKVKQFVAQEGQEGVSEDKKVYDTAILTEYIKVPIYVDESGNMIVEDIPEIIAAPEKAEIESTEYVGTEERDTAVVSKINDGLVEFFKAYYSGEQTQLDFLLEKERAIKVVAGTSKFDKINSSKIYKLSENEHLAIIELNIKSFNNDVKQRVNVTLIKNGDKYLVKKLDTRTSNLNIN